MSCKGTLTKDVAKEIFQYYPFYRGEIDDFSMIPQKLYNHNAIVTIGTSSWVLKCYPQDEFNSRLLLAHDLQLRLDEAGFPLAKLEQTKYGKTMVKLFDAVYSLHKWTEGKHLSPSVHKSEKGIEIIQKVARAIGNLHRIAAAKFKKRLADRPTITGQDIFNGVQNIGQEFLKGQGLSLSGLNKLRFKLVKSDFDRWVIKRAPELANVVGSIVNSENSNSFDLEDPIPIHNDINWENLIFSDDDELLALIDFDNVVVGPREYEVGAAAIVIAGPDNVRLQKFVEAYQEVSGFECNPEKIQLGMILKCIRSIVFSIHSYASNGVEDIEMLQDWCFYLDGCLSFLVGGNAEQHVVEKPDYNEIRFSTI